MSGTVGAARSGTCEREGEFGLDGGVLLRGQGRVADGERETSREAGSNERANSETNCMHSSEVAMVNRGLENEETMMGCVLRVSVASRSGQFLISAPLLFDMQAGAAFRAWSLAPNRHTHPQQDKRQIGHRASGLVDCADEKRES